ncbi:hypothetical protein FRC08_014996, partial [Ceratobasidium sp. 394]
CLGMYVQTLVYELWVAELVGGVTKQQVAKSPGRRAGRLVVCTGLKELGRRRGIE